MTRIAATGIAAGATAFFACVLATLATARADDADLESRYLAYHRAIHAAELCEQRMFDQDDQERLSQAIDEELGHAIGAGRRLTLIEQAKSETREAVDDDGCDAPEIQELLARFHSELEPALGD